MNQAQYTEIIECIKFGAPAFADELIIALNKEINLANQKRQELEDAKRRETEEAMKKAQEEKAKEESKVSNVTKK